MGDCPQPVREIKFMSDEEFLRAEPWTDPGSQHKGGLLEVEPKCRYPDFWTIPEAKRAGLERHEMSIAEAHCFKARKFSKMSGAFGKGLNVP